MATRWKILVAGATGNVGRQLVDQLVQVDADALAVVRNPEAVT
jgi:uncharacterized protein YbjT (DUF2867 family)